MNNLDYGKDNKYHISYPVISSEEAKERQSNLLPDGDYKFSVAGFVNGFSTKNPKNPMITVDFIIYKDHGHINIKEYFLPTHDLMLHKFRLFCDSIGLSKEYENGDLDLRLIIDKTGYAKIGKQSDKNGKYEDKNVIKRFYEKEKSSLSREFEDEIGF
jgi:hypothetical protein